MPTVLVIDDDQSLRETLSDLLSSEGHTVLQAADGQQAIEMLRTQSPDAALCDWRMSPVGGLDVLRALQPETEMRTPIIVLTAYGDAESTVQAMQAGAYDFLVKPIDVDAVLATLNRALEHVHLQKNLERLQSERFRDGRLPLSSGVANGSEQLVGKSPAWIDAFKRVGQVAQTELTVLLEGETGTGKEVVAKVIHRNSQRAKQPYIAVNCAAIPEDLVESELFGHERGSFTGATSQRLGSFEQAEGGTIFLDEIGEMPLHVQPKLLRVLQEKTFQRVGGTRTVKANVRVIAATNRSLAEEVEHGRFRADLYYRLNAYRIELPPLRDRKADIAILAEYFLGRFAAINNMPLSVLDPSAKHVLEAHAFPGNVRELEQLMNKLAVESAGRPISGNSVQSQLDTSSTRLKTDLQAWEDLPFHEATARWERYLIERALQLSGGNKSDAARRLGIQRRLLYEKMQRYAR